MKLFILLVLLVPLHLFSANTDENYIKGLEHYKAKDFKSSYALFSKIYLDNLGDVNFNFAFGRSAYETGHYAAALAAFERVEIQDGSNLRNRLEMARTYFMLKMYEDSENAFKDVLANPDIPKNVRTNIELSLSRVSKVQQKSFTYVRVMLDVLYDSNVNYGSIGDYQFGGSTLGQIEEISDTAVELYGNVVNIYDIGDKSGFAIKNAISAYYKDYTQEDDYNLLYLSYSPSLLYSETHYTAELMAVIDTMTLGKKRYLSSYSLVPRLELTHTPTLRSIIHFKYQMKQFIQDAQENLDANRIELSYGLQDILTPRSYIQGNIVAINEAKVRGDNIYVDFNEYKLNLTYANQFTSLFSFDAFAQLRMRNYQDKSNGFDSVRSDLGGLGNAGFTMKLMPTLRATLKGSYEYVDSNQDRFTYHKYTAMAGVVKTF